MATEPTPDPMIQRSGRRNPNRTPPGPVHNTYFTEFGFCDGSIADSAFDGSDYRAADVYPPGSDDD